MEEGASQVCQPRKIGTMVEKSEEVAVRLAACGWKMGLEDNSKLDTIQKRPLLLALRKRLSSTPEKEQDCV